MKKALCVVAIMVLVLGLAGVAAGDTWYWDGADFASWTTLTNWNSLSGGGGSTPASITNADTFILESADKALAGNGTSFAGNLQVDAGGVLDVAESSSSATSATVYKLLLEGGKVQADGATSSGGSVTLSITNGAVVNQDSEIYGGVYSGSADRRFYPRGTYTGAGDLNFTGPRTVYYNDPWDMSGYSGNITVSDGTVTAVKDGGTNVFGTGTQLMVEEDGTFMLFTATSSLVTFTCDQDFLIAGKLIVRRNSGDGRKANLLVKRNAADTAGSITVGTPTTPVTIMEFDSGALLFGPNDDGDFPTLYFDIIGGNGALNAVAGTDYDQINFTRAPQSTDTYTVTLTNALLDVNLTASLADLIDDELTILQLDAGGTLAGMFENPQTLVSGSIYTIDLGGGLMAKIDYAGGTGNDVVLFDFPLPALPVAEPAGLSLVGLALLALKRRRS